jgi:hypothetical protein
MNKTISEPQKKTVQQKKKKTPWTPVLCFRRLVQTTNNESAIEWAY